MGAPYILASKEHLGYLMIGNLPTSWLEHMVRCLENAMLLVSVPILGREDLEHGYESSDDLV